MDTHHYALRGLPLRNPIKAVGYVRVSTLKQGDEGIGLDAQSAAIRDFAAQHGIQVDEIYEDDRSGMGQDVLDQNEGLRDALKSAESQGIPLLVHDLSRVARNVEVISTISKEREVSIMTVVEGMVLDPSAVARKSAYDQAVGKRISENTKKALAVRKAAGVKLGNRTNLKEAQQKGVLARKLLADDKVAELVKLLSVEDPGGNLTAREVVTKLNDRRIVSGRGKQWTVDGVRRPLRQARAQLDLEGEVAMHAVPHFRIF